MKKIIACFIAALSLTTCVYADGGTASRGCMTGGVSMLVNITQEKMNACAVLRFVNEERANNGLSPLVLDTKLTYAAQMKAEDMVKNDYFDHNSPTYGDLGNMLAVFNITGWTAAGENIAFNYGDAKDVVDGWMNSPGHRQNILNENYTKIGIGNAAKGGERYWVQVFSN